jgi:hypothetical protein
LKEKQGMETIDDISLVQSESMMLIAEELEGNAKPNPFPVRPDSIGDKITDSQDITNNSRVNVSSDSNQNGKSVQASMPLE